MKVTIELKNGESLGPYTNIHHVDLFESNRYVTQYTTPTSESDSETLFINVTDDVLLILMEEDDNG